MERKYKRLICIGASVCVLAVLAVTMFIGASRSGYFSAENSIYSGQGPSSGLIDEPGKFMSTDMLNSALMINVVSFF